MTRSDHGFSIVEVLVAMILSLSGVLATGALVSTATSNGLGHERQVRSTAIAQNEIEVARTAVKRYGFARFGLCTTGLPAVPASVTSTDPNSFLVNSGGTLRWNVLDDYRQTSATPLHTETVLTSTSPGCLAPVTTSPDVNGNGSVDPGELGVTVHRYVTDHIEPCAKAGYCDGDSKRLVIAVVGPTTGQSQSARQPVFFQTTLTAGAPSRVSPDAGGITLGIKVGP